MSGPSIPCKEPWSSVAITNARDMVKITVGKDNQIREYEVHVDVLRAQSGYFRKKLPEITEGDEKGKRAPLHFPNEPPAVLEAFVHFLHHGKLHRLDLSEGGGSFLFLCQLSVTAAGFEAPLFSNAIVDGFIRKMYRTHLIIPYDIAAYLQEYGRDTALRAMFIDLVMDCGNKKRVYEWGIALDKGYFKSVYDKGGVVPFGKRKERREYLDLLWGEVCERYHEHSEEGEMEAGEWPAYFSDPPLE